MTALQVLQVRPKFHHRVISGGLERDLGEERDHDSRFVLSYVLLFTNDDPIGRRWCHIADPYELRPQAEGAAQGQGRRYCSWVADVLQNN